MTTNQPLAKRILGALTLALLMLTLTAMPALAAGIIGGIKYSDAGSTTPAGSTDQTTPPAPTAPAITTNILPNGAVGATYSQTLTATGTEPITWDISGGSLPGGLSLSETGVLSGTPTTGGAFSFTVRATNSKAPAARQTFSMVITVVVPPRSDAVFSTLTAPKITTTYLPIGAVGTFYSQTIGATGTQPISWDVIAGKLPGGLAIAQGGVLLGTPTAGGTFNFTLRAANGITPDATQRFSMAIGGAGTAGTTPGIMPPANNPPLPPANPTANPPADKGQITIGILTILLILTNMIGTGNM